MIRLKVRVLSLLCVNRPDALNGVQYFTFRFFFHLVHTAVTAHRCLAVCFWFSFFPLVYAFLFVYIYLRTTKEKTDAMQIGTGNNRLLNLIKINIKKKKTL